MVNYKNEIGKVTEITKDIIYINNEFFFTNYEQSKQIVRKSEAKVGDNVRYNSNSKNRELIYLRVIQGSGLQECYDD